jgi:hypothetical protein
MRKVAVLAVPRLQLLLGSLGFAREDYRYPLVTRSLGPPIPELSVADNWYLSAGD